VPAHERSHLGIGRTYQITNIFPKLSVLENIRIAAQSRKMTFNLWSTVPSHKGLVEKSDEILERINLTEKRDELAGQVVCVRRDDAADAKPQLLELRSAVFACPQLRKDRVLGVDHVCRSVGWARDGLGRPRDVLGQPALRLPPG